MFTQEELKEAVHYDPETGVFTYLTGRKLGKRADKLHASTGYMRFQFKGYRWLAHRFAWFYTYGDNPEVVDHINGNKTDNRICNLRPATQQENCCNSAKRNNPTNVKGVTFYNNKYVARVGSNGKMHNLGSFNTKEEAEQVVRGFREKLHGEFYNHG